LDIVPAHPRLVGAEIELVNMIARETKLKSAVKSIEKIMIIFYRLSTFTECVDN